MESNQKSINEKLVHFIKNKKVITFVLFLIFFYIVSLSIQYFNERYILEIEIKMPQADIVQVYYRTSNGHYSEINSKTKKYTTPGEYAILRYKIPCWKTNFIRIDPGTKEGVVIIKKININIGNKNLLLDFNRVLEGNERSNHVKEIQRLYDQIKIVSIGNDPYFEINGNISDVIGYNFSFLKKEVLIIFIIMILLFPFAYILLYSFQKLFFIRTKCFIDIEHSFSNNNCKKLINLNIYVYSIVCFFLIIFVVLTYFKIHYSSIGQWDDIIPDTNNESTIIGKPRGIRSDEWLVATPFILSQYNNDFPIENFSIGSFKSPLISSYNLPVKHFTSFFRIQHWGFYLFGKEIGFSYYWNFKLIGLMLVLFLFFLIITGSNIFLSLLGSFWVTFSSFTQWWFSICLPEQVIFSMLIIISFLYLVISEKIIFILISSIVLLFSMVNFLMLFYLPWQIALSYFMIFAVLGIIFSNYKYYKKHFQVQKQLKVLLLFFVCLGFFSVAGILVYELRDSIKILLNTVYPCLRSSTGGTVNVFSHFSGFFEFFNNAGRFPSVFGNICESSRFILFYPLVMILLLYYLLRKRKINVLMISMGFLILLIDTWQFIGMNQLLSKILLLDRLPENRAFLPVGLASIIMVITYFSEKNLMLGKYEKIIIIIISLLAIFLFANKWNQYMNSYLNHIKLTIIIILISICFISIITKNKYLFAIILFLILSPNLIVNPICEGLSSIYEKRILFRAKEIMQNDSKSRWAVFGSLFYPQIFKVAGIPVINGVNYLPDLPRMQILSNGKNYSDIYNRYAHFQLKASESDDVLFELHQGDLYSITIRPDSHLLKKIGVKYVILPGDIKSDCFKFKKKLTDIPITGFNIYELY